MAADDLPQGGMTAQTVGVVHVVVPANASENGLAELLDHSMPPVLDGTDVLEKALGNLRSGQEHRQAPSKRWTRYSATETVSPSQALLAKFHASAEGMSIEAKSSR